MKKIWKFSVVIFILVSVGGGLGFYYFNKPKLEPLMQEGQPFDFEMVRAKARGLAAHPYLPQKVTLPEEVAKLDYDQHRDVRFMRDKGPWFSQQLPFEIQLFHLGSIFTSPVKINEIKNGRVSPLNYSASYFDFGKNRVHPDKWGDIGFAGFRLHYPLNTTKYMDELNNYFKIGEEVVCYQNNEELINLIKYYLSHEEEREKIRNASYKKFLAEHTYHKRAEKILQDIEKYREQKF